jgi:hypothetical protein
MACLLPFRPWLSLGPRVFRFRTTGDQSTDPHAGPLLRLRATSVAFPFACRSVPEAKPTLPPSQSSSHRSTALQHIQTKEPFFSPGFWPGVQPALPHRLEVPPSGFGYPLGGVSPSVLGNFLGSPRSWASLFRALIRLRGRPWVSPRTFRSCASEPNPAAWYRRSSGLCLRGQQCLLRSPPFYQRRMWPLPS